MKLGMLVFNRAESSGALWPRNAKDINKQEYDYGLASEEPLKPEGKQLLDQIIHSCGEGSKHLNLSNLIISQTGP